MCMTPWVMAGTGEKEQPQLPTFVSLCDFLPCFWCYALVKRWCFRYQTQRMLDDKFKVVVLNVLWRWSSSLTHSARGVYKEGALGDWKARYETGRMMTLLGMMLVTASQQGLSLELRVILAAFNMSDLLTDLILIIISFLYLRKLRHTEVVRQSDPRSQLCSEVKWAFVQSLTLFSPPTKFWSDPMHNLASSLWAGFAKVILCLQPCLHVTSSLLGKPTF